MTGEPTGWRKEPRFTVVASGIGVGAITYAATVADFAPWLCVILGFALGLLAGMNIGAWKNARMVEDVTAMVVRDVKRIIEDESGAP